MSDLQKMKDFVLQRLHEAVDEIFTHLHKTISDYEEEIKRHRARDARLHAPDVQLHNEPPPVKEEAWTNQDAEQIPGYLDEDFAVKTEHDFMEPEPAGDPDLQGHVPLVAEEEPSLLQEDRDDRGQTPQNVGFKEPWCYNRIGNWFFCSMCHKRYNYKYSLQRHMLVHAGIRPYACPFCRKAYYQKKDLDTHLRGHHKQQTSPTGPHPLRVKYKTTSEA